MGENSLKEESAATPDQISESSQPLQFDENEVDGLTNDVIDSEEYQLPTSGAESTNQPELNSTSVAAKTHAKKRSKKSHDPLAVVNGSSWKKLISVVAPVFVFVVVAAILLLVLPYRNKTLANVVVAGVNSGGKTAEQLKTQLQKQQTDLQLTLHTDSKELKPKLNEIGFSINIDKTVENAMKAKRHDGVLAKLTFWKQANVSAVITVNDTLLNQYVETHTKNLSKPAQDARLVFDANSQQFIITNQADGQGPDTEKLKAAIIGLGNNLQSTKMKVGVIKKHPIVTQQKLQPLLQPANELIGRRVVLTGHGKTYTATAADIAAWVTPTPKPDGSIKLVIDPAKIQSYVDGVGKMISSPPQDKKVIKDEKTGKEVVLQQGREGTELADKEKLANAIATSIADGQDSQQNMNIKVAAFKTVNMNAYSKWIEVDLSAQRLTAYEKATPVKSFLISSGVSGHETVTGEFSIWLKVRSQTMKGGSKATGDYYNLPNVEWVNYFYQDYALHGAYWHHNWGHPMSHGCVNEPNDQAKWVYEWAPLGTKVIVHY